LIELPPGDHGYHSCWWYGLERTSGLQLILPVGLRLREVAVMNLFEKYGGVPAVSRIVSSFYREVVSRPTLQRYFEGVNMPRLIDHQVKFISHLLGQPASVYEGRELGAAHRGVGITGEAFAEVADILRSKLVEAGMEPADVQQVMAVLAGARQSIVQD
jgi:hemoglobin